MFKQLELKDKIDGYSYEQKLDLLLSDGKIIKRPIIEFEDKIFTGFREKEIQAYLDSK